MSKSYLLLQGPHGPYFRQLAKMLRETGADVRRIAFNFGDEFFWTRALPLDRFNQPQDEWSDYIRAYFATHNVTDLIIYGDTRFFHAEAIQIAQGSGITVHCFEEGYLRPYWATYEREGVNGFSALNQITLAEVQEKRASRHVELQAAPAQWGSLWHHNWFGFLYHFMLALGARRYPNYRSHRNISLWREVALNARRFFMMPLAIARRDISTRRFLNTGSPFYVVLMQLEHDASFRYHGDFETQKAFIEEVVAGFAKAAPNYTRLIFKLHPLEDGRTPIRDWVKEAAQQAGCEGRVRVFDGGKLGSLLNRARGALAVNSTSVQQALWRGIPVKLYGRSVFNKPELVSQQATNAFFAAPDKPHKEFFLEYRTFLLETSQLAGGYYTVSGRAELLRVVVDLILASRHPYDN